ncbi:MAG: hypothetical protein JWL88_274 [Parcubacteria group bacterium]|nr:hypothetical protein [Parcubacteria group bacterium]
MLPDRQQQWGAKAMYIKSIEWGLMALYAAVMIGSFWLGKELAKRARLGLPYGGTLIRVKIASAWWSYLLLWAVILWSLLLSSQKQPNYVILAIHLPFALASLYLGSMIKFRKNGVMNRESHAPYALGYVFTAAGMIFTGGLMLVEY